MLSLRSSLNTRPRLSGPYLLSPSLLGSDHAGLSDGDIAYHAERQLLLRKLIPTGVPLSPLAKRKNVVDN